MIYYTYAYLREDRTPYYIGKGKGDRVYDKGRKEIKPPKDKSRIIFLKQNLTEEEAFKHEIYMIAVFGRKDLGTGILHNRTDGGEGKSGYRCTEETKLKISKATEGKRKLSKITRNKLSNAGKKSGIATFKLKLGIHSLSKEEIIKNAKSGGFKTYELKKGIHNLSKEIKSEIAKSTNSQKWKCLETGFITNPGSLSRYQRARGIDTSKRVRILEDTW